MRKLHETLGQQQDQFVHELVFFALLQLQLQLNYNCIRYFSILSIGWKLRIMMEHFWNSYALGQVTKTVG